MTKTIDLPECRTNYTINQDHIVIDASGQTLHIDDTRVLGISSHLVSEEMLDFDHITPKRRYVDIEYLDADDQQRIVTIDEPDSACGQLPDYIDRVAAVATDNTLVELLENDTVSRKGFTITDQGMMVTASGQSVWFALSDLSGFTMTGGSALVWQRDQSLPIAIITSEDPNAAVLCSLLPKLIQANGYLAIGDNAECDIRYMVGSVECSPPHQQTSRRVAIGFFAALIVPAIGFWLNLQGILPGLDGMLAIVLPLVGLGVLYFKKQSKTLLFVYRDGISIVNTRRVADLDLSWSEMSSSTITLERVEIPTPFNVPNHVFMEIRLSLRYTDQSNAAVRQLLSWKLDDLNDLATDFLVQKLSSLPVTDQVETSED